MNPQQGEAGILAAPGMGVRGESGMNLTALPAENIKVFLGAVMDSWWGFGEKQWPLYFTDNAPVQHEQGRELMLRIWSCTQSLPKLPLPLPEMWQGGEHLGSDSQPQPAGMQFIIASLLRRGKMTWSCGAEHTFHSFALTILPF